MNELHTQNMFSGVVSLADEFGETESGKELPHCVRQVSVSVCVCFC